MILLTYTLITIFLLFVINLKVKNILNISNIFSVSWGISLLSNFFLLDGYLRVSDDTYTYLFISWWVFLFGTYITQYIKIRKVRFLYSYKKIVIITFFLLVGQLSYTIYYLNIIGFDTILNFNKFALLRLDSTLYDIDPPFILQISKLFYISYLPLLSMLFINKKISKSMMTVLLVSTFLSTILNFSRAPLLSAIIICVVSYYTFSVKKPRIALILFTFTLLALLFIGMQFLLNLNSGDQNELIISISSYIAAPIRAFESIFNNQYLKHESGLYSFDSINYLMYRMGIISDYPPLIRNYIYQPVVTNVYTFLDSYVLDFGKFGGLLMVFILSVFVGIISKLSEGKSYIFVALISLISYYMAMSFLNNEFIRLDFIINVFIFLFIEVFIHYRKGELANG